MLNHLRKRGRVDLLSLVSVLFVGSFEFGLDDRLRTAEALFELLRSHRMSNDEYATGLRLLWRFRPFAVYLRPAFLENPAGHFRIGCRARPCGHWP